jgi:peptide alpha-N-acetyltransferase
MSEERVDCNNKSKNPQIIFVDYRNESQIDDVMQLVSLDLSEPYSIFTYRYFLHRFPDLCILAVDKDSGDVCGCVVGKIDLESHATEASATSSVTPSSVETTSSQTISDAAAADTCSLTNHSESQHQQQTGYIGMLAVSKTYRRQGIGKALVRQVLQRMKNRGCTSVTLETEMSNVTAQKLYQNFGFVREEVLRRYYLNNGDAYRLRLWF